MSMVKPMEAWDVLLRQAIDDDFDERENYIFQIGLVLERHSRPNLTASDLYEENLSRALLRLTLDDARHQAAVVYLATLVKNNPESAESYLYALSRAKPEFLVEPLLKLLKDYGKSLAPEAAFQAVAALNACLKAGGEVVINAIKAHDPSSILAKWADGDDDELADKADRALEKVENILNAGGDA
jgi:hypothetical protein